MPVDRFTRFLLASPTMTVHEAGSLAKIYRDRRRRLENRKLKPPVKQAPLTKMRS